MHSCVNKESVYTIIKGNNGSCRVVSKSLRYLRESQNKTKKQ